MKKIVHSVVAAATLMFATGASAGPIVSAADAALTGATVINFDSLPGMSFASRDFGPVTFNAAPGSTLTIMSHQNQYGTVGQSLNNPGGQAFEAVFDGTVSAFGIMGGAVNAAWTYTAYGVNNNVLEVLNLNDPCCNGYFHGIAATGIKRVTFSGSGDWVAFDDFRFAPTKVPEPGSLALLGLGLFGFVASRRKKS